MPAPDVTTRILRRLLANGVTGRAERLVLRLRPAELAPILADLTADEIRTVMELLFRHRLAAKTMRELPLEMVPKVVDALTDVHLAEVLSRLEIDDLIELIEAVPEDRRDSVISQLRGPKRQELEQAQRYPPGTAGRVMTTHFVVLREDMTAQEAIDRVRASGDETESIFYLYVTGEKGVLRGVVPIRRLVTAPPDRPCSAIMIREPVSVRADASQEEAAQLVSRYNLLAIPVTDAEDRMLGVITVDDVIEVIHEEATEDIYHLAGLSGDDRVFTPPLVSVRKRLPWMLVNLLTAFLAAWVVGLFERSLHAVVALAIFLPVVAGMGGNGATQTLTVITRAIALGEIEFSTGLRAISKELVVGIAIGTVTGLAAAAAAVLWQGSPYLGLVLFLSMIANLAVAGLAGASVPLLLKALNQDPALGSGVIVTTFTDCCGFFAFLGIATLFLDRLG